jgi:hypothetical protein
LPTSSGSDGARPETGGSIQAGIGNNFIPDTAQGKGQQLRLALGRHLRELGEAISRLKMAKQANDRQQATQLC